MNKKEELKKKLLKDVDVCENKTLMNKIMLKINLSFFSRLLNNNEKKIIGKKSIIARKIFHPLLKLLLPLFAKSKLVILRKEKLPSNVPLIFAPTHGFRDDVAHSLALSERHSYILFGSLPAFFNSFDGISSWSNGVIMVNRKDDDNKKTSKTKCEYAIKSGVNLTIYPEGVWNKNPNLAVQKLFPGVYDVAKNTGALVVPVITLQNNGITYGIRDEAFDITQYDRKEGLKVLRDKLASGKYEIMEQYCHAKREEFGDREQTDEYWKKYLDELIKTARFYDEEIENTAEFRDKNEISYDEVLPITLKKVPLKR